MWTTEGQTVELMDQPFMLTWRLTTAFYETAVATNVGEKNLGGGTPPPLPQGLSSPCYGLDNPRLLLDHKFMLIIRVTIFCPTYDDISEITKDRILKQSSRKVLHVRQCVFWFHILSVMSSFFHFNSRQWLLSLSFVDRFLDFLQLGNPQCLDRMH